MDITVNISDAVPVVSQSGFGLPLIFCTTAAHDYEEYDISEDITSVAADFASGTEIYKMVNTIAGQSPRPQKVAIFGVDLSASIQKATDLVEALNTLILTNGNWYRLLLEDKTETLIAAASEWAETNGKSFYTTFGNTTFTTDFSIRAKTNLFYKENTDRVDAAAVGYATTRIPGTYIFKFRNLNGITADALTPSELLTIRSKKMNAYISKFGNADLATNQLDEGFAANGKPIDYEESKDWVKYRITQEIARLLMNTPKLGADDAGIASIVTAVTTALDDATANTIIRRGPNKKGLYTISYLTADNLPEADIVAGRISGISFKYAYLFGIKEVAVSGSVVVNL